MTLAAGFLSAGSVSGEVRFNRHIRPIFAKHCTACHGGVSFDLTGLPPSADDLIALEKEWQSNGNAARESVVDKLLASPTYGEKWASVWLDLARYADTTGFERDHRDIWPWRDWVIKAFNEDKPYDQFTIEQMAGDLLPDATPDQILATAFHRNTQTNSEGDTDDEEYRPDSQRGQPTQRHHAYPLRRFGIIRRAAPLHFSEK